MTYEYRAAPGTVYLVGAGPGDPGLITAKGLACLESADAVVFDRLVSDELISRARADAVLDLLQRGDHAAPDIAPKPVHRGRHGRFPDSSPPDF